MPTDTASTSGETALTPETRLDFHSKYKSAEITPIARFNSLLALAEAAKSAAESHVGEGAELDYVEDGINKSEMHSNGEADTNTPEQVVAWLLAAGLQLNKLREQLESRGAAK